ncbi:hypothetical protein [Dyella sp. 2RAB6]|uniref:hypothetical protein n=1 Tax=Dyella sp. 2RAB6 TaxID=3232992 RepID=UPI003F9231B8
MSELPVIVLVPDVHGEVERAAEKLRGTGLRNPMVYVQSLHDMVAWGVVHARDIAFLIMHADTCRERVALPLPAYPAFAVESVDGRLMASIWPSPGARATPLAPFDAPGVVRSLQRLGLRWLVI